MKGLRAAAWMMMIAAAFFLGGCSGGGGGGGSDSLSDSSTSTSGDTGTLSLSMIDKTTQEYDAVFCYYQGSPSV